VTVGPSPRCYPREDSVFADDVATAISSENGDVDRVAITLRSKYPLARIAVRDPLAEMRAEREVWYVYRDGKAVVAPGVVAGHVLTG
jgi:hypothetical protein